MIGAVIRPSRSRGAAGRQLAGMLAVGLAVAAGLAGCASTSHPSGTAPTSPATSATTTSAPPTSPPTTATTTTAPYQPTAARPSADDAASALLQAWGNGDRTAAGAVASPPAVAALFALPYPGQSVDARGCSGAFSPEVCSYRDGNDLIEVAATQVPAGWYVSSVTVES